MATIRAAQKLGAGVVGGFTGSPLWSYVAGYPGPDAATVAEGFHSFAHQWNPILDVCRDTGIRFAFEVHPGQIAFDLVSAEMALEAYELDPATQIFQQALQFDPHSARAKSGLALVEKMKSGTKF